MERRGDRGLGCSRFGTSPVWTSLMDYQRLLALLEERRAILLWEELWPDRDDEDGELARQMRMEEIELLLQELVRISGHA